MIREEFDEDTKLEESLSESEQCETGEVLVVKDRSSFSGFSR